MYAGNFFFLPHINSARPVCGSQTKGLCEFSVIQALVVISLNWKCGTVCGPERKACVKKMRGELWERHGIQMRKKDRKMHNAKYLY